MPLITRTVGAWTRDSMYAHPALLQAQSPLLRLPAELRLQICGYMTLSPTTTDWNGAFFSCRQLHQDMLNQLHSRQEAIDMLDELYSTTQETCICLPALPDVVLGAPHPLFSWIRSITITVELSLYWDTCSFEMFYALHLDNLQILLVGDPNHTIVTPYGDLTTLGPPGLDTPSGRLSLDANTNCKKITLTLDQLANTDDARDKQISYEVAFQGTELVYLFIAVQNKEGKQVERSYTFDTRFEMSTPLPPIKEAEGGHDGCEYVRKDNEPEDCEEKDEER